MGKWKFLPCPTKPNQDSAPAVPCDPTGPGHEVLEMLLLMGTA